MYIDIFFLLLILFFMIVGYFRGLTNQLISVAIIFSFVFFAKPLADWLKYDSGWTWFRMAPDLVAWGFSAFAILLLWMSVSAIINMIKKAPGLTPLDHWLGVGLGGLKGMLIVLMMGVIIQTLPEATRVEFPDLERDTKKSVFLTVSRAIGGWDSLSTFKSLGYIQRRLETRSEVPLDFEVIDRAQKSLKQSFNAPAPREIEVESTPGASAPWAADLESDDKK